MPENWLASNQEKVIEALINRVVAEIDGKGINMDEFILGMEAVRTDRTGKEWLNSQKGKE